MKRVRLSPAERRDQLIGLGAKMLSLTGLEQLSIDDIARAAGISRGLLFHYFPSKRDFHLAVVQRSSDDILAALVPNPELEPLERLRDVMARYIDYVSEHESTYVSLLRGPGSGDPELQAILEANRAALVAHVLEAGPLIGANVTPRVELAARGWIAFVEETTISWLRERAVTRDELLEMNVAALPAVLVVDGLAAVLDPTQ